MQVTAGAVGVGRPTIVTKLGQIRFNGELEEIYLVYNFRETQEKGGFS